MAKIGKLMSDFNKKGLLTPRTMSILQALNMEELIVRNRVALELDFQGQEDWSLDRIEIADLISKEKVGATDLMTKMGTG